MSNDVFITNIAAFLPNDRVSNDEMEARLGQAGERPSRTRRIVLKNNGITSRYYAIDPETGQQNYSNAKLAALSIQKLINDPEQLESVDVLAYGTSYPDQIMPGHAVMVHGELACPPMEVSSSAGVCVAGVNALKYAYLSVKSGDANKAIAGGSEVASATMRGERFHGEIKAKLEALENHPEIAFEKDFLRWMLSDGAGSALLENTPRPNQVNLRIDWIGVQSYAGYEETCMYAGGVKNDSGTIIGWNQFSEKKQTEFSVMSVKQDVKLLNEKVIHYTVERALTDIKNKYPISASEVDWFLPHYSSKYFRDKVYQGLKNIDFEIPYDKWFTNLSEKGNTGSASIFIMLEELFHSGKLEKGQTLLCYVPESGRFSSAFIRLTVV